MYFSESGILSRLKNKNCAKNVKANACFGRTRNGFAPLLLRFRSAPIEAEEERRWSGANRVKVRGA